MPASTRRAVFLGVLLDVPHVLGLMGTMLIPLMLGSKVVYIARFSPMGVFDSVKQHGIEVLIMVPTMYAVMASAKAARPELLQGLDQNRHLRGRMPLPVPLIEQFKEKFNLTLMEGFGLTETSPIVAINLPWAHKPGSVGKLIPHVQVKTVDDNGGDLPMDADGGECCTSRDPTS